MIILKSLTMPKNVKGGPFRLFLTSNLLQNIEKTEGDSLEIFKKFWKKSQCLKKIKRGDPLVWPSLVRYVKNGVNERGPFALTQMRFCWPVQ